MSIACTTCSKQILCVSTTLSQVISAPIQIYRQVAITQMNRPIHMHCGLGWNLADSDYNRITTTPTKSEPRICTRIIGILSRFELGMQEKMLLKFENSDEGVHIDVSRSVGVFPSIKSLSMVCRSIHRSCLECWCLRQQINIQRSFNN